MAAAYTWSKVIGLCCEEENNAGPRIKALNYLDLNRTVLNSDRTHNLQITAMFELPFGRGKRWNPSNGVVRGIVSGWQINTLTELSERLAVQRHRRMQVRFACRTTINEPIR